MRKAALAPLACAARERLRRDDLRQKRELVIRVYHALTTLRLILAYWPVAKACEVPRILRGKTTIWRM